MIEIRDATQADIPYIWTMGERVDEFHTSNQAPNFWPEPVLKASIHKKEVMFVVAIDGKDIAGFIIANCNLPLSKVLIENIYVQPDMRQQGIGGQLVAAVLDRAKAGLFQFVSVLTPPDDVAAIATYEKAGFAKGDTFLWLDFDPAA